jgi:hypothetical protein
VEFFLLGTFLGTKCTPMWLNAYLRSTRKVLACLHTAMFADIG